MIVRLISRLNSQCVVDIQDVLHCHSFSGELTGNILRTSMKYGGEGGCFNPKDYLQFDNRIIKKHRQCVSMGAVGVENFSDLVGARICKWQCKVSSIQLNRN